MAFNRINHTQPTQRTSKTRIKNTSPTNSLTCLALASPTPWGSRLRARGLQEHLVPPPAPGQHGASGRDLNCTKIAETQHRVNGEIPPVAAGIHSLESTGGFVRPNRRYSCFGM